MHLMGRGGSATTSLASTLLHVQNPSPISMYLKHLAGEVSYRGGEGGLNMKIAFSDPPPNLWLRVWA